MGTKQDGYKEADDGGLVPLRNTFLIPTAKLDDQKFEFYFLLDISGSMYGKPFQLASRAILVCLNVLHRLHVVLTESDNMKSSIYLFIIPNFHASYCFIAFPSISSGRLLFQRVGL